MIGVHRERKQAKINTKFYSLFSSNKTQIILVIIALLPSIILFGLTFVSLWYFQNQSLALIQNFAEQLFQDQINNSKMQNSALLYQINQQVQMIAWQLNLINEYYHNVLLGIIVQNKNYIPTLFNQDRAYYWNEDPVILSLFQQNDLLTSIWHHVSKSYISELDERGVQELTNASIMDVIWRPILYDNKIEIMKQLKKSYIYFGHSYDGLVFLNSKNSTYEGFVPPSWCPYTGPFLLDVRCRYYYMPAMMSVSIQILPPQLLFGGLNGESYLATAYCQRRLRYEAADPNSHSDNYGVLCMDSDLSQIPSYFKNFGSNSKFQMFLDPRELTVVYDSLQPLQQSQIATVQQFETQYLQDQTQAKKFLDNISQNYQFILSNTSTIQLSNTFDKDQPTFEYNRNGTECFVIMNTVKMIDKVPKYEYLRKVNPSSKYQIKSVYLFLDVLSKHQMQQYSDTLQNTIKQFNIIFTYISWGIIVLLLAIQFYYSILLGKQILSPLIHLTNILKQIRVQNKNKISSQHSHHALSQQSEYQPSMYNDSESSNNEILIDEQLDADVDGVCFSSDTQILLESFQNMFKILRFTTQNFYKENESISLLNLNIQIEHFQQFGNYRAMGVCHNNMGVIHYNCGRYQEAVEHFQRAIVYTKYELNTYSHDLDGNNFWGKVHRFSISLRNSCQTRRSSYFNHDSANLIQNMNTNVDKSSANSDIQQHLYWNLYNRNENYLKALSLYIRTHQNNLWELFLELAYENTSLSQIFLPPSYKREVMNFYVISMGYNQLSLSENNSQILQRIDKLYRQSVSQMMNIVPESSFSNSKITHPQSPHFRNNPSFNTSSSGSFRKLVNQLLLSPLRKNKKEKDNSSSPKINCHFDTSSYNKFSYQNQKYFNLNPTKNNTSLMTQMNNRETHTKQFFPQTQDLAKLQNSVMEEDSQLNLMKQYSANENLYNQEKQSQELTQKQIENKLKSGLKNLHQDYSYQSKLKIRNKLSSIFQQQNSNSVQDSSNEFITLQTSERTQKYWKAKVKLPPKQKSGEKVNQKNKKLQFSSHIFNRNNALSDYVMNDSILSSKLESSNQMDNQFLKSFINQMRRKIDKQMNRRINYPVRKMKSDQKISCYEFNSDIIFIYYALQQSKYFISQNQFFLAAELLSNAIEKTKYYLPHHKMQILQLLTQIFKTNHIESTDLKEMKRKYKKYITYNFHICLISSCHKNKNKEKVYALSQDFTQEILFKEKDTFGLLSYSFEEHLYLQLMSFTSIQTIKSNFLFFESIFCQLLHRPNNLNPEGNQLREAIYYEHPLTEQSFLNEINKRNNLFDQDNINQCNQVKIQKQQSIHQNNLKKTINNNNQSILPSQNLNFREGNIQIKVDEQTGLGLGNSSFSNETILKTPQNNETINDSMQQNYYLIEMEILSSKSSGQKSKINGLNLQNDQSTAYHKIFPYLNSSMNQRKNKFLLKSAKVDGQNYSFNDLSNNSIVKNLSQSSFDQAQQQQQQNQSLNFNKKLINNSLLEKTDSLFTQENSKEANTPLQIISFAPSVLFEKNNNPPLYPQQQYLQQNFYSAIQQTQAQLTETQQNDNLKTVKLEQQLEKDYSPCEVERITSEQVFHQGVNTAIKQFILNTEQKLTSYLTKKKFYDSSRNSSSSSSSKSKTLKKNQVYIIYVTDQPLEFKQKDLLNYLCDFLINLEIELLVLEINENQSCEEFSLLQNIVLQGKSVITFFHTEAKLLQYIYNTREHLKNNLIPMIFEHF